MRPAVSQGRAQLAGSMPDEGKLSFSIVLPLRNEADLDALLQRLYDPSSADYRQFLSVADFTERFAPTAADYATVLTFAKANGLEVTGTPANRMVIPLKGTVAAINTALHVRMSLYQHPTENRVFFSPDREPSLALSVPVAHISGLNNFSVPKPMMHRAADGRMAAAVTGSGPNGSYLAGDMRTAYYGGTQLTGMGQAVGLLEFGGYDLNDVKQTFSSVGTSYAVPINNVLLDGATGLSNGSDGEQVLDIVQAIGMAPGLSQVRVYIGTDDADILNSMASENIAKSLSCSWGWYPDDPGTDDVFFKEFAAQGQSFFVASGDYGAWDTEIAPWVYPAEDAYVTTVGGTHLTTVGAGGPWQAETSWNGPPYGSGGGISPDGIAIPSWQTGAVTAANGGSTSFRNAPDVSMEGDFDNYNCEEGICAGDNAGTSFAAPRWAAFTALINQQAAEMGTSPVGGIGFLNPALYAIGSGTRYANDFHDILTGDNLTEGQPIWFNAGTGYDLVTGWGSPTGQNLINELAGPQTLGFWLSASSSTVQVNPGGNGSTSISIVDAGGFTGKVQLAVTSALPTGVIAAWGTNPTTGSSVLALTAASTATNTTTTLTITGTSGSINETTHVTLAVHPPAFSLSASPDTLGVLAGSPTTASVIVTPLFGFTGSVALTASGLPAGVTATFGTNPTSGTTLLTLQATSAAVAATSNITITGKSGQLTATMIVPITVLKPTFKLANNGDVTLGTGASASNTIYVENYYGFQGAVTLSVAGLPSGLSATFGTNPTTSASYLTFTPSSTTPLGTSTVTVTGQSGSLSATTTFKVNVVAPSFTLTQLGTVQIGKGTTTTVPVYVNPMYGFTGAVNLAIAGLPSGVTASLTPNPTPGNSTLTLTASSTAAIGASAVTVTGTSGSLKATASMTLEVFVPTFTLSNNGPVSIAPGTSTTMPLSVNALYGFTGSVNLTVAGLPSGITAAISPNPTTGAASITLTASTATALGNGTLTVTGSSGTQTATTSIPLTVGLGTFTLYASGSVTLGVGSSAQESVSIYPGSGLTGGVTLSLAGLPSGVTASISPNPTTDYAFVNLVADSTAKPGNYTVTINGTSTNAKAASTTFALTVGAPSFTLSNYGGQTQVGQGSSATITIIMSPVNGFLGTAHLTVSGLPSGVMASFAPALITGGSSTLMFTATSTATVGTSTVTVTGTSGSTTATTSFPLQVGVPTFTLSTGGVSITPGGTASGYVSVNPTFGFTGSATLSVSGLPAGVTGSFAPDVVTGNSQLNLTASGTAAMGVSTVTVTGVSGSVKATSTFLLTIAPGTFYLQAGNGFAQFAAGATVTSTVSVLWSNPVTTGDVVLGISGLPAGVTATFSPTSTSTTSVLTLIAASTAATGNTNLTITGTLGKTTTTTNFQIQIQPMSFSLSGPYSYTIGQGQSATTSIYITPVSGFTGTVNLSASGLPAGVTASFSPTATQTGSTLTLTASSTAALAGSVVTITGTSGSVTASTQFPLTVSPLSFNLGIGSTSLGLGTSSPVSVYVQGQNGFSGAVTLAVSGLPSGVTATVSPNPATSNATITLTASASASVGQYNAVVTGTSGKLTASSLLNITVAAPSFTLSSYGGLSLGQGASTQTSVQVNPLNGFTGSVQLSVTGLPSGVSASFLPTPTNSNSTLTLTASTTAPLGQYNATLVGTYGTQIVTIPLNLSIYAPKFTLSTYQAPTLAPGSSTPISVGISSMYGFSGAVHLSASGLPAGVTATFSPASATTQSTLTFTAATSAIAGESNITVSGVSGTATSTVIVPLTIAAPTFTLWGQGISVGIGSSNSGTIYVSTNNGFTQPVQFAASGVPSGITVGFSPNPGTGSTVMTVAAAKTLVAGQYLFTVTGTGGGQTATSQVQVDAGVPSFTLYAYSVSVSAGSSSNEYISVSPTYGFSGAVQFSATGLPAGVTASFSPSSSTSSTNMTLNTTTAVKPGQYNLNVVGTSGSQVKTAPVVLTVLAPSFSVADYDAPLVGQGNTVTTYVYVQSQTGFEGSVNLSITGLPSGVTAAFSPNPATNSSILSLTASSTTSVGQYTATVKGTSGALSATTQLNFTVGTPSFSLSTYGGIQIGAGTTGQQYISENPAFGFAGSVQYSVSGLPAGVTGTFSPVTSTSGTSLVLAVASTVQPGQYSFTVTGKSGSLVVSVPVSVLVVSPAFTLNVYGGTSIGRGTSGTVNVYINGQNGFTGAVQLTASGLPSGVTATISPNPATGTSVLTLTASSAASLGQYTVTLKGVSGTQSASTAFTVGVYVPTFQLGSTGNSLNIGQGTSAGSYITINNLYGFTGQVQLSVSGLPAGVTATFSANPTTSQSLLTLTASSTAALAQSTLTITGTSGTQTATTTLQLGIYAPTFSITGGTAVSLFQGSSTTDYLYINAPYGLTAPVQLALTGLPSGVTASISPNPTTYSSAVTLSAASNVVPGLYSITVSGTSGAQSATSGFTLYVPTVATTTTATINTTSFPESSPGSVSVHVSCNSACGKVLYQEDGANWATVTLDANGNYSSHGSLPNATPGQHTMTVTYLGNAQYAASTSNTVSFTILPPATTTTATINTASFPASAPGSVSVHVSCNSACGKVLFQEDGANWATVTLDANGNYSSHGSLPNTTVGQHTMTVTYLGSAQYASSMSNTVNFTILQ
ncbi:hypothetical protein HDF16_006125 [Granulicella aggregans]|uniref:Peptidase S53 domain-containing protein n=1 Tax=Granulicella aggregans TaxID=474949 RepID=A0A7W7ZK39_9BACT|nr:hypothetical protein [Granulicella aggregans]